MSVISHYGEFEAPEEKTEIEVVEDPVRAVLSCYDFFKQSTKDFANKNKYDYTSVPLIYDSAVKIFDGKEKLSPSPIQMMEIFDEMSSSEKKYDYTGLFLSALLNKTALDVLIIIHPFHELEFIGHLLALDKTLFLGPNISENPIQQIGFKCKGNVINNCHGVVDFATGAKNGVQINYTYALKRFAEEVEGGIQINLASNDNCEFASKAKSGIQINRSSFGFFGNKGSGGVRIRLDYDMRSYESQDVKNCMYFDARHKSVTYTLDNILFDLNSKIKTKCEEIPFSFLPNSYKNIHGRIASFDFNKFKSEISDIVDESLRNLVKNLAEYKIS